CSSRNSVHSRWHDWDVPLASVRAACCVIHSDRTNLVKEKPMRRVLFLFVAMVTVFATLLPSFAASGPIVIHEVKHDVSLPARDMGNNLPVIRENKFGLLN